MDDQNRLDEARRALAQIAEYARRQEQVELERGFEGAARTWRHVIHLAEQLPDAPSSADETRGSR